MIKKIPFDSVTLASVVAELQPLVHSRIQKIVQPDPFTLILFLYSKTEIPILLSCHPEFYRVHACTRRFPKPKDPIHFGSVLKDHILAGSITSITQRGLDRILDIKVETDRGTYTLSGEFMSRHSNLLLIAPNQHVLAIARPTQKNQTRRLLQVGKPYSPPPFPPRPIITNAHTSDNLKEFEGWSPFLQTLVDSGANFGDIQSKLKSSNFQPQFVPGCGAYPIPLDALTQNAVPRETISIALEQHYSDLVTRSEVAQQTTSLLAQLNRVLLAREVALQALQDAILAAKIAPISQLHAELILAYQAQIKPGDSSLNAWNYEGEEVSIRLNSELTPIENANKLFKKAKRAKERLEENQEQSLRISKSIPLLKTAIQTLESAESLVEVQTIKEQASQNQWLHSQPVSTAKEDRPYSGFSIRELESPGGFRVLYGTNATSNDHLTSKVAKPNDYWLHVRGQTSTHVVIQTHNQPEKVQRADLEWAARIAVKNSLAKNASYVPVDYTLKKYVRKPRGSAPGLAVYEREKTIHIEP